MQQHYSLSLYHSHINTVTCMCVWLSTGSWIGFIDHLNTWHVTTLNYSAVANFNTLQFTSAHAKSFVVFSVFSSNCLVTASKTGYSSASGLKSCLNGSSLPTVCLPYNWLATISHQPPRLRFTAWLSRVTLPLAGLPPISSSWRQVP
jgi:hypothetical protein